MNIGSLLLCLRIPGAVTLKDKRSVVRGLVEKLRRRFGVAVAEVGDQGLVGNATLGIAAVAGNRAHCEELLARAFEFVESHAGVEVYDYDRAFDVR